MRGPKSNGASGWRHCDGSICLCIELVVTHDLEESFLLRRRDKFHSARDILPDQHNINSGGGLLQGLL